MRQLFLIMALVFSFTVLSHSFASSSTSTTLIEAVASPAPAASPEISKGEKLEQAFKKADEAIPGDLAVWILAALAFLAELLMRLFPTFKPKSLLLLLSKIFTSVGSIFAKLSGLLDKVAQNIKDEPK